MGGIDAGWDRVAANLDVVLRHRQPLAGGDADLLLDDVDTGDHLGHRMLDLDACIHLDEVELAFFVEVLESTGTAVADLAAGLDTALADTRALLRRELGCRGLLHDLLVPSLHGAIPLAEMDHVLLPPARPPHLPPPPALHLLFHIVL